MVWLTSTLYIAGFIITWMIISVWSNWSYNKKRNNIQCILLKDFLIPKQDIYYSSLFDDVHFWIILACPLWFLFWFFWGIIIILIFIGTQLIKIFKYTVNIKKIQQILNTPIYQKKK